jgi:2-dehydropantoate 2-reductase
VAHSAPVTGLLDLGRYPSGVDGVAESIAGALQGSTFESVPRPDIMRWKYRKLIMNLTNAVEALSGREGRDSAVAREARKEGEAVLSAAGIDVASTAEDRARRADLLQIRPTATGGRNGGSSWQSLERGTGAIESEFLNGEIVLLGALSGVATPVNTQLMVLALQAAADRVPAGSWSIDALSVAVGVPVER